MKQIILLLSIIISSIAAQALKLEHSNYKDTNIYFVNFNPEKFDKHAAPFLRGMSMGADMLNDIYNETFTTLITKWRL